MPSTATVILILIVCALLSFLRAAFAYKFESVRWYGKINFDALGKAFVVAAVIASQYGGR